MQWKSGTCHGESSIATPKIRVYSALFSFEIGGYKASTSKPGAFRAATSTETPEVYSGRNTLAESRRYRYEQP